jgi:hypothetical protein
VAGLAGQQCCPESDADPDRNREHSEGVLQGELHAAYATRDYLVLLSRLLTIREFSHASPTPPRASQAVEIGRNLRPCTALPF